MLYTLRTKNTIPEAVPPEVVRLSDFLPTTQLLLTGHGRRRAPVGTATRLRVLAARVAETEEALVTGRYIDEKGDRWTNFQPNDHGRDARENSR